MRRVNMMIYYKYTAIYADHCMNVKLCKATSPFSLMVVIPKLIDKNVFISKTHLNT